MLGKAERHVSKSTLAVNKMRGLVEEDIAHLVRHSPEIDRTITEEENAPYGS